MAGPFPGMDPYVEIQAAWPDFHNRLIAEICNELGARLSDSYVARVDERIEVATWALEPPRSFRPDVLVGRFEKSAASSGVALATAPAATLEPKLVEILDRDPEEVRITWVEIRALPDLELVTAIEVLSPINKFGHGRQVYLEKRDKLHGSRVNLVEIDLLLGGAPLPMKEPIEPGAYYAIVARARGCRWRKCIAGPSVIPCLVSQSRFASPTQTYESISRSWSIASTTWAVTHAPFDATRRSPTPRHLRPMTAPGLNPGQQVHERTQRGECLCLRPYRATGPEQLSQRSHRTSTDSIRGSPEGIGRAILPTMHRSRFPASRAPDPICDESVASRCGKLEWRLSSSRCRLSDDTPGRFGLNTR